MSESDCPDYKDAASDVYAHILMGITCEEIAFPDEMPDGDCCPRSFMEWFTPFAIELQQLETSND